MVVVRMEICTKKWLNMYINNLFVLSLNIITYFFIHYLTLNIMEEPLRSQLKKNILECQYCKSAENISVCKQCKCHLCYECAKKPYVHWCIHTGKFKDPYCDDCCCKNCCVLL